MARGFWGGWVAGVLLAVSCLPAAWAADGAAVSSAEFAAQITSAEHLAAACAASAAGCQDASLPSREQVTGAPGGSFHVSWSWLGEELRDSRTAKPEDRAKRMKAVEDHLSELAAEAGQTVPAGQKDEFGRARLAANAALARGEFRAADGPTWIQRQLAHVQDWFLKLFTGMDRLGRRAPWLAPLIEWGCFALAAAGLLWFVRQSLARQALRISLSEGVALSGGGDRDAADWARLAQERAAAEDWREAVHCLFWAAIALMETRRAWKPNATRTPREYVRLLKPGSAAQNALRDLTRSFERAWYGSDAANKGMYEAALQSFRALEEARPERSSAAGDSSIAAPVAEVA